MARQQAGTGGRRSGDFHATRALRAAAGLAAVALLAGTSAWAQDVRVVAPAPAPPAADDGSLQPLSPDESDILARALVFDPATLADGKPARALKHRNWSKSADLDVKGTDRPDGSSAVALKQPIAVDSPDIDSSVGADVNLAAHPSNTYQPGQALPGMPLSMANAGSGGAAAWASVGMPNFASVQARVDPAADQGKIGGKLSHSLPVGRDLSVTVEDSYTMTESLGAPPATANPTSAAALPATAPPAAGQVFDNSKSVKFVVGPTGTSFGAGWTSASNDPVTHNTLSADQRLMGPLHVTTAVTDVGQPTVSKRITAGFKLNW
jgi:hypothetical protein